MPENSSVEKKIERNEACHEPEGNIRGEDSARQPTEQAAQTPATEVEDADDSDPQELPANLKVKAEWSSGADGAGSLSQG